MVQAPLPADLYPLPGRTDRRGIYVVEPEPLQEEFEPQNSDGQTEPFGLRRGFRAIRESLRLARADVKALGHLAVGDLGQLRSTLDELRPAPAAEAENYRDPRGFWERVQARVQAEEDFKRRRHFLRRRELKERARYAGKVSLALGAFVAAEYLMINHIH